MTHEYVKPVDFALCTEQSTLTLVCYPSILHDALRLNAAQELKVCCVKMPMMVS